MKSTKNEQDPAIKIEDGKSKFIAVKDIKDQLVKTGPTYNTNELMQLNRAKIKMVKRL